MRRRAALVALAAAALLAARPVADVFRPPPPSEVVEEAFGRLAEASGPHPLSGSSPIDAGRFAVNRPCTRVIAAYRGSRAPVPEGASVRLAEPGLLLVEGPYGTSAILTSDAKHEGAKPRCIYLIASEPTLEVTGAGKGDTAGFTAVGCDSTFTAFTLLAEYRAKGKPWVVLIGPEEDAPATEGAPERFRGAVRPGTIDGLEDAPGGPKVLKVAEVTFTEGKAAGEVRLASGEQIRFRCTTSFVQLLGGA